MGYYICITLEGACIKMVLSLKILVVISLGMVVSCPMTCSSSSSAISSTEAVVFTTATFLAGGQTGEQACRGGEVENVVKLAAMWPFFLQQR